MANTSKNLVIITIVILSALSFKSCERKTLHPTVQKEYPNVDKELWVFFQIFEEESAKRGLSVDLISAGIIGRIENLNIDNVVGMCGYNPNASHQVTIDKKFWDSSSFLKKELIVFHELGHCYLDLKHFDETHPDGRCKSIMRSGFGTCMETYTNEYREEYQNQLFEK